MVDVRASIFMLIMLLAGAAMAQDIRIGYVDMKRLLDNAPQVIAGRAELDIEFRPINDDLLADEARLLDMEQALANATGLASAQVAARQREIRTRDRSIERSRSRISRWRAATCSEAKPVAFASACSMSRRRASSASRSSLMGRNSISSSARPAITCGALSRSRFMST